MSDQPAKVIDLREPGAPAAFRSLPAGTLVKGVGGTDTVWRITRAGSLVKVRA